MYVVKVQTNDIMTKCNLFSVLNYYTRVKHPPFFLGPIQSQLSPQMHYDYEE